MDHNVDHVHQDIGVMVSIVLLCGSCPSGYTGNGERCKRRLGCDMHPCSPGVECENINEPPYFACGSCPNGYTGNGTNCHDIDEVCKYDVFFFKKIDF
ncbi:hypothetical protein O3M35_003900 [Rhynocoris fuscipes]|uniref:Uncharacterized protein n=1 Tax=Rhynocoris fuscipes TaxID=488301 RepID=A0AAW1CHR9_9HEMI